MIFSETVSFHRRSETFWKISVTVSVSVINTQILSLPVNHIRTNCGSGFTFWTFPTGEKWVLIWVNSYQTVIIKTKIWSGSSLTLYDIYSWDRSLINVKWNLIIRLQHQLYQFSTEIWQQNSNCCWRKYDHESEKQWDETNHSWTLQEFPRAPCRAHCCLVCIYYYII